MRWRLIEMREEKQLTREAVAQRLNVNVRSVHRWETGESTPQQPHRAALARLYERPLADVLRAVRDDDGAVKGHKVTKLGHLVSLEQGCGELHTFETTAVPGLLQTPEYATVVESASIDHPTAAEVARRVALRIRRQQALHSLRLWAVIDASVLLRQAGRPEVMTAQVVHLREMAVRPNISVRVLPLTERAFPAASSFMLFTSPDDRVPFMVVRDTAAGPEWGRITRSQPTWTCGATSGACPMAWTKSTFSTSNGACVEIATPDPDTVLLRNSQHPDRGTLAFPVEAMATFVGACKAGELDGLT